MGIEKGQKNPHEVTNRSRENLRPFGQLSEDRQRELSIKGGKARQEQVKQRKSMKESLNVLLSMELSQEKAEEISGESLEGGMTMQEALMIRAIKTATEGNVKALEFIRDTSGNKPKEEIAIDGNVIMTEADRRLLDNLSKRLRSN